MASRNAFPPHPLDNWPNQWPKPVFSQSSVSVAAGRLWRYAEARADSGADVGPLWLMDGAMAYCLDMLEDVRKRHRLPLNSTLLDLMAHVTPESMAKIEEVHPGRARFIVRVLTAAIDEREARQLRAAAAIGKGDQP